MTKRTYGLIKRRIDFATGADYSNAQDVQNFIQEQVNREAFLEWCAKAENEPKTLLQIKEELDRPLSLKIKEFFHSLIP